MTELLGWIAAALTLLTFACNDMRRLRVLALAANFAFVAYASQAGLWPVLALHLTLAPINLWRLRQALQRAPRSRPTPLVGRADPASEGRARRRPRPAHVRRRCAARPAQSAVHRTTRAGLPPGS